MHLWTWTANIIAHRRAARMGYGEQTARIRLDVICAGRNNQKFPTLPIIGLRSGEKIELIKKFKINLLN